MSIASNATHLEMPILGRTARVGFGCCPMGGHGWGATAKEELVDAVHLALELGVNFFDTSDVYGLGVSEEVLGNALRASELGSEAIVATKFGVRVDEGKTWHDNSPSWIRQALDGSLRRLGRDVIDLYQLHYWDGETPQAEIYGFLEEARIAGKIRAWGVTNMDPREATEATYSGLASFSYEYSLGKREFEARSQSILDELGLAFWSWGSLGQGVFGGRYDRNSKPGEEDRRSQGIYTNFHGPRFERNLDILDVMRELLPEGASLSQLALRWILDRMSGAGTLVGIKRPEQIQDLANALQWTLPPEHIARLDEASLGNLVPGSQEVAQAEEAAEEFAAQRTKS